MLRSMVTKALLTNMDDFMIGWHECVVPIVTALPSNPEFPGIHGSGFLVSLDDRVYLFTARHCLGGLDADFSQVVRSLRIAIDGKLGLHMPKPNAYIHFDSVRIIKANEELDLYLGTDGDVDIAIAEADLSVLPNDDREELFSRCLPLPKTAAFWDFFKGIATNENKLLITGFPRHGTETEIDYDAPLMTVQGAHLKGVYTGAGVRPGCGRVKITDARGIERYDGFSGGPVLIKAGNNGQTIYYLAGMVVTGSSEYLDFLDLNSLIAAFNSPVIKEIFPPEDAAAR